jgi:hypothetical protein
VRHDADVRSVNRYADIYGIRAVESCRARHERLLYYSRELSADGTCMRRNTDWLKSTSTISKPTAADDHYDLARR